MPVSLARAAAFDVLLHVERDSSYASDLLHSAAYQKLSTPDHALATELVMGVLRWRARLDHEIASASSQPLEKLDLEILIALRLAVYQFRHLDRIPHRAALHESVELVKRARKRSAVGFVNAVLRKLSERKSNTSLCSSVGSPASAETLAANFSHPLWLVERWTRDYGLSTAQEICGYDQSAPVTTIRLRTPTAESELAAEGISISPGAFLTSARRVQSGDVTKTKAFRSGRIAIQDEASQLVAALVSSMSNEKIRVLDCCAAPGGKTLAVSDQNPHVRITAAELHPHRTRLMKKLFVGSAAQIQTLTADARHLPFTTQFDRVLADVPCSGTGTLARNPEIKWRLTPKDLTDLRDRQLAILRSATARVALRGQLIYSTCSLEKEENEDVVEQALAENNTFRLVDCHAALEELKAQEKLLDVKACALTRGPYLRTIPGIHPCDGFFAAILERR
jgi:16S rRNA (cytosine967-C5)-methyltransferase